MGFLLIQTSFEMEVLHETPILGSYFAYVLFIP